MKLTKFEIFGLIAGLLGFAAWLAGAFAMVHFILKYW